MKISGIFLLAVLSTGCGQPTSLQGSSTVLEYFMEVILDTDAAGDFMTDAKGQLLAVCRLGQRTVKGNDVKSAILERKAVKASRIEKSYCSFEKTLPHRYCAMSSSRSTIDCKVSISRGGGWFAELGFVNPQSTSLHCSMACFD